jgi:anti-sigma28 factor (negative regulator of flagellin synthesis)
MRIETARVSQPAPVQRAGDERNIAARRTQGAVTDTTDLLAISAGVAVAHTRDAIVNELRQAYRSGALQPDPERIASRLMEWGFEFHPENSK